MSRPHTRRHVVALLIEQGFVPASAFTPLAGINAGEGFSPPYHSPATNSEFPGLGVAPQASQSQMLKPEKRGRVDRDCAPPAHDKTNSRDIAQITAARIAADVKGE